MNTERINTKSIGDQIYEYLKNSILERNLKPGEKINIESLASRYSISRSPIKTAIDKLVGEGFLIIKPRQGTFVTTVKKEELIEYLEIRFMIECYTIENNYELVTPSIVKKLKSLNKLASNAAEKNNYKEFMQYDKELHMVIVSQNKNTKMKFMYNQLNIYTAITLTLYSKPARNKRMFDSITEHNKFIKALESRDALGAKEGMKKHAFKVIDGFKKLVISD